MYHLCKLAVFISLIFYGASYGSQDNTGYDKHESSNHRLSYEDYAQSFSSDLSNLLTALSLYYDEFRLPLRVTEIACHSLLNFYLLKLGNTFHYEYLFIAAYGTFFSLLANAVYDIRKNKNNPEDLSLFIFRFFAQRIEHISSLYVSDYLSVKLFSGPCPICLEPVRYPIEVADCRRHWYCTACIRMWEVQSPLCPVCRQ
ncbi:RING finger domain-containing protein [Endozoicomonas sp. ONNA1]|uniref:RING finger domain-containing protein n=1 Tax=unclassified Endozoicomonas TaxID=2644528 RepID=UPI0034D261EE